MNRLDAGEYDDSGTGYDIHLAVAEGGNCGYFDFTAQHNVTMWRWLIAATFVSEMKRENGTTTVTEPDGSASQVAIYSNGKAGIVVYPFTERLAMANSIEGLLSSVTALNKVRKTPLCFISPCWMWKPENLRPPGARYWQSYMMVLLMT